MSDTTFTRPVPPPPPATALADRMFRLWLAWFRITPESPAADIDHLHALLTDAAAAAAAVVREKSPPEDRG